MTATALAQAPANTDMPAGNPMDTPFMKELVKQIRAQDSFGAWDKKKDEDLLAPYVVSKEQRRQIPLMGDPEPEILQRVEWFYAAVGLAIEKATGHIASPIMKMHHEGFGRVVLTAGRLVAVSKHLRDVHRYGYDSLDALSAAGTKAVDEGVAAIRKFPDAVAA